MTDKSILEQCADEAGLLQLALLKQARTRVETVLGAAGAHGQITAQQAAEQIAQLSARTQTETAHTDDVNAIERIKAAVGRGADNNELISQRINSSAATIADTAAYGLSSQIIGSSVANSQLTANIVDHNHKNSNFGRGFGVLGLLGVGDAVEETSKDTDRGTVKPAG